MKLGINLYFNLKDSMDLRVLWRTPYMSRKWHLHTSRYGYILPLHYTWQEALHLTKVFLFDCFQSHRMEQITEERTAQKTCSALKWILKVYESNKFN